MEKGVEKQIRNFLEFVKDSQYASIGNALEHAINYA